MYLCQMILKGTMVKTRDLDLENAPLFMSCRRKCQPLQLFLYDFNVINFDKILWLDKSYAIGGFLNYQYESFMKSYYVFQNGYLL